MGTTGSNFVVDEITYERVYVSEINMRAQRHAQVVLAVRRAFDVTLRPFQASAIADVIDRDKDVFVIAGTSAGKSMVYQGLSAAREGSITLVISPTISLMMDQVCGFLLV